MPFDYEFLLRIQAPRPVVFEKLLRIEHLARWFSGELYGFARDTLLSQSARQRGP